MSHNPRLTNNQTIINTIPEQKQTTYTNARVTSIQTEEKHRGLVTSIGVKYRGQVIMITLSLAPTLRDCAKTQSPPHQNPLKTKISSRKQDF